VSSHGHPLLDRTRPLAIAHRGGAALAPENTLEAFDRGLAAGADGLELDVRLSRDGHVVVIHDATVGRTTDGSGAVADLALDALRRLDAGARFIDADGQAWRGRGLQIPTLQDVLARYPDRPIIVELKGRHPELARAAVGLVRQAGALERVCFGGFEWRVMREARSLEPTAVTSAARMESRFALWRSRLGWSLAGRRYHAFQLPETSRGTRVISPDFIEAAHAADLPVQVWTVNREADMTRLLAWGADAIITDRPDVAVRVLRARPTVPPSGLPPT
jgi:glycerophosphoryl diester phosphodiesterase